MAGHRFELAESLRGRVSGWRAMRGRGTTHFARAGLWIAAALMCLTLSACVTAAPKEGEQVVQGSCQGSASLVAAIEQAGQDPTRLVPLYGAAWSKAGNPNNDLGFGMGVLAAIHKVESGFRDGSSTPITGPLTHLGAHEKAQGPMQFIPSTWARYGNGGDPQNVEHAIDAAARYVATLYKEKNRKWDQALLGYNRSTAYVQEVLELARGFQGVCQSNTVLAGSGATVPGSKADLRNGIVTPPADAPKAVQDMIRAANQVANLPYVWGGGHPAGQKNPSGYDCSGLTMYVLRAGGYDIRDGTNMVAANFVSWGEEGQDTDWVQIYANSTHVYMVIAGVRLDAENSARKGSAWRPTLRKDTGDFTLRRPRGLNSGAPGGAVDPRV